MTVTLAKPQSTGTAAAFSHIGEGAAEYKSDGLRDFFSTETSASPRPRTAR